MGDWVGDARQRLLGVSTTLKTGLRSHDRSTAEAPRLRSFLRVDLDEYEAGVRVGDGGKSRYKCGVAWRGML